MYAQEREVFGSRELVTVRETVIGLYGQWQYLNTQALQGIDTVDALEDTKCAIAETATQAYQHAPNAEDHLEFITQLIQNGEKESSHDTRTSEQLLRDAQAREAFGQDIDTPNVTEALLATAENIQLAEYYTSLAGPYGKGALLSGSTAWGAHYTPKRRRPEYGNLRKASDVDLLIEVESPADIQRIIDNAIKNDAMDKTEAFRAEMFARMYSDIGTLSAEMFSVRTDMKGKEVSIHFVLSKSLDHITNLTHTIDQKSVGENNIPYIRDFRPNTPRNGANEGYDIHDLSGVFHQRFRPKTQEVRFESGVDVTQLGYICESPLGGPITTREGTSYGIGLLTYFLAVSPILVGPYKGPMSERVRTMQASIQTAMGDRVATSIPRMRKMSRAAERRILDAL